MNKNRTILIISEVSVDWANNVFFTGEILSFNLHSAKVFLINDLGINWNKQIKSWEVLRSIFIHSLTLMNKTRTRELSLK